MVAACLVASWGLSELGAGEKWKQISQVLSVHRSPVQCTPRTPVV